MSARNVLKIWAIKQLFSQVNRINGRSIVGLPLILDWYRHVSTIVYRTEPRFFTVFAADEGKALAREFVRTMVTSLRYDRQRHKNEPA